MARNFARLNPAAIGPSLELEDGGLVVTSNAVSLNISRMVRGTVPILTGMLYFEVAFWGDGALLNQAAVGIVRQSHSLAKYVGEQSTGYGFKVGNGGIYSNNALVTAAEAAGKEVYIGVLVDMTALTCTWLVNGSPIASVSIANAVWYPAITVSATEAYALRCYANFGQYEFEYPQTGTPDNSGDVIAGWYQDTVTPTQLHLCAKGARAFNTRDTDSLQLVTFEPRILNARNFEYSRKCNVWTSGSRNDSSTFTSIDLDNKDGRFDAEIGEDRRDQIVTVVVVRSDLPYDSGEVVCTGVVDSFRGVGEDIARLTIKDRMTSLERPLQRRRMPPWADDGVANTPVPITLGAVRNVSPPLEDAVNRKYRLHDGPITNIVSVRDKGAPLDPHSSPPQYSPTKDADGLLLETDAIGLLTVDMSSEGDQVVIPGAADILSGAGLYTTWPNPAVEPPGWLKGGTISALVRQGTSNGMPQNYVAALSSTDGYNPAGGDVGAWLRYDTANLLPGKTYRIQFKLVRTSGSASNGIGYGLMVRSDLTSLASGAVSPNLLPLQAPQFGVTGQAYTFTHTIPAGSARKLYFIAVAATNAGGLAIGIGGATWYDVKIELLGQLSPALPLIGIKLAPYLREIFRRAHIPDSDWVSADAEAIDDATGYEFGVHINQEMTIREALQLPLDSYCATMFTDRFGRYRVRRLIDPSTIDDGDLIAEFDETNVQRGVDSQPDLAPGLTTSMGARTNWRVYQESDFVTDTLTVPPALRTQFKRQQQFIEPFAGTLAPTYSFATLKQEIPSLFDNNEFARTEIARVCADFVIGRINKETGIQITTLPRFITFTAFYSTMAPPEFLFCDGIRMTYRRHRLEDGQKLVVFDVAVKPLSQSLRLVARGTE
jgi:hypothetical protein